MNPSESIAERSPLHQLNFQYDSVACDNITRRHTTGRKYVSTVFRLLFPHFFVWNENSVQFGVFSLWISQLVHYFNIYGFISLFIKLLFGAIRNRNRQFPRMRVVWVLCLVRQTTCGPVDRIECLCLCRDNSRKKIMWRIPVNSHTRNKE